MSTGVELLYQEAAAKAKNLEGGYFVLLLAGVVVNVFVVIKLLARVLAPTLSDLLADTEPLTDTQTMWLGFAIIAAASYLVAVVLSEAINRVAKAMNLQRIDAAQVEIGPGTRSLMVPVIQAALKEKGVWLITALPGRDGNWHFASRQPHATLLIAFLSALLTGLLL